MATLRKLVIGQMPTLNWLAFFALILGAWVALFMMPMPASGHVSYAVVMMMWGLMTAAMMAPTFVPTLKTYRDLTHTKVAGNGGFLALLAGYLAVWLGFSGLAAGAQLGLLRLDLVGAGGASLSWGLNAVLLAFAGGYQFSRLKNACLSECRAPLTFFMGAWQPGITGAARMGLRLGVICLGCCWALMALGFVGGTMNLLWMGIATFVMVVEKLPELGRHITRPLGILLLAGSAFSTLAAAFG